MPPNTVLPYQLSLMWGPFSSTENKGQEFVVYHFMNRLIMVVVLTPLLGSHLTYRLV